MKTPKKTIIGTIAVLAVLRKIYKSLTNRNEERIGRMAAGESISERFKRKR